MNNKIALIGYGYWGKTILPYLEERFNVVHIFGRSLKPQGRFTNNLQDIWDDDTVTAVVVATPINAHYEIVLDALKSCKHVLCEKPLTMIPWQAVELQQEAAKRNLHLVVDFTYTFSRSIQEAAYMFSRNAIGDLNYIETSLMRRVTEDRRKGFTRNELYAAKFAHLFPILNMFVPLEKWNRFEPILQDDIGLIRCYGNSGSIGQLRVSTVYPAKFMGITVIGTRGRIEYRMETSPSLRFTSFEPRWFAQNSISAIYNGQAEPLVHQKEINYYGDEANNLTYTVEDFDKILQHDNFLLDNTETAVTVTRILAETCNLG